MDTRDRIRQNPFFVLALPAEATPAEIERTGRRLLGELAIGREAAQRYATPLGQADRTADAVRAAMADLRAPARRLVHEAWARIPVADAQAQDGPVPWSLLASALGVRDR